MRKNHLIGLFLTFEELQSTCDARCHPTLVCAQAGILITPALPFDQGFSVSITSVEVAVYIVFIGLSTFRRPHSLSHPRTSSQSRI